MSSLPGLLAKDRKREKEQRARLYVKLLRTDELSFVASQAMENVSIASGHHTTVGLPSDSF